MLDISKLPPYAVKAIRDSYAYADQAFAKQVSIDHVIALMSPEELLDAFLEWHGIRGYTHQIIEVYEAVKAAERGLK